MSTKPKPKILYVWVETIAEDGRMGVRKVSSDVKDFEMLPGLELVYYDEHLKHHTSHPWSRVIKVVYDYPRIQEAKMTIPKGKKH
jgi:hypothetical protein